MKNILMNIRAWFLSLGITRWYSKLKISEAIFLSAAALMLIVMAFGGLRSCLRHN